MEKHPKPDVKFSLKRKKRILFILKQLKFSFIFVLNYQTMKKITIPALLVIITLVVTSCTTYRGNAGGGCQMNRNLVGYK